MNANTTEITNEITKEQTDNARKYLELIKSFDRVIAMKKDQMQDIYSSIDGMKAITYDGDRVQTSQRIDAGFVDDLARMDKIIRDIRSYIAQKEYTRDHIIKMIDEIEDSDMRTVLYYKYMKGMQLKDIAKEIGFSDNYIRHLAVDSVKEFYKIHSAEIDAYFEAA